MTPLLLTLPVPATPAGSQPGRMFPSSALASAGALVAYAVAIAALPILTPREAIRTAPYPPPPVVEMLPPLAPPAYDTPRRERSHEVPPAPAEPVVDMAQVVPVPVADENADPPPAQAGEARTTARESGASLPAPDGVSGGAIESTPDFVYYEVAPLLLSSVKPEYPRLAWDAGVEGTVVVRALVNTDGRVVRAEVLQSVPLLDAAALDTAQRLRFRPAEVSGRPVSVWVAVPIRFSLH